MIKILTKEDYDKFVEGDDLKVIRFHASWCAPCKTLGGVIENMKNIEGVEFAEIDVDSAEEELVSKFNIRSLPTLVFMKNGLQIDRNIGSLTSEALINKININKSK